MNHEIYTTAPTDYDYSGTVTIDDAMYKDTKGTPLRKVQIDNRIYEGQVARYGSGLHLALTQEEVNELLGSIVFEM
jgi:hypothetical protein